jgi:glutaminase
MDEKADEVSALVGRFKAVASPLRAELKALHERYAALDEGDIATYIPELAKADPSWFGICVVTAEGETFAFGDVAQAFTIQSISKPFVYGLALQTHGREATLARVGVEPTGDAFNSIVKLDEKSKRPHNPMVNAGAIAAASLITGSDPVQRLNRLLDTFRRYVGHDVNVDMAVFTSERATGHRNRAIAHLMRNFGMIGDDIEESLDLYFKQCSILVNCRDLAVMAATLANDGVNPLTGEHAVDGTYVRDILSVMYTCGMYDYAGEWAYRVGLPAKSGVSGGVIAVAPRRAGIAVFSPRLDERGNSVRGIKVCEELSHRFGLHLFEAGGAGTRFEASLSIRAASAARPLLGCGAPAAAAASASEDPLA